MVDLQQQQTGTKNYVKGKRMAFEHTYIQIHISSVFVNFFSKITNIVDSHLIFAISNKKMVFFLFEYQCDKPTTLSLLLFN